MSPAAAHHADDAVNTSPASRQDPSTGSPWVKRAGLIAAALGLFLAWKFLPVQDWILGARDTFEDLGVWGPIAFGAVYVIAALLFVPGSVITLAAGTFFGVGLGTAVVSVASTLAAAIAFPLARSTMRDRVKAFAEARPAFAAIDAAIADGGWKVVGLLRLSPVVPFSALNYMLGLTRVRYVPAVLVSWLAMLPGTLLYVYIGSLPAEVAEAREKSPFEWVLLGVGLVASLVVTVVLTRMARARMNERDELADVA